MRKFAALLLALLTAGGIVCNAHPAPKGGAAAKAAPKSDDAKMNAFINQLMSKMTLDEKIGQTVLFSSWWDVTGPVSNNDFVKEAEQGLVGAIFNARSSKFIYRLQKEVVEKSRLHIPLLFGYDVIHGYSVTFPIPLAQSASWDMQLIEKAASVAAAEAAADGLNWTYAPMVDIARDPRWGRVAEGAGEDQYLGSLIAKAQVHGFQGKNLKDTNTILACAKHYAAYGAAQAGRDYSTVDISERYMRDYYLPPFKAAKEAGVATFMTAFNEYDGTPCSANEFLLTQVLRKEWGFKGFVVTDYTSIAEMINHGSVKDEKEAGEASMNAGVDMDMQSGIYMKHLKQSIKEGKVAQQKVEDACRRILEMKYRLGLFDDPYRYCDTNRTKRVLLNPEHFKAAHQLAARSIVLLKNSNNLLPLSKATKTIALVGPLGDDKQNQLGTWHTAGRAETVTPILAALKEKINGGTVIYAKGSDFQGSDKSGFAEAIAAAQKADVVLMALGETENMSGEANSRSNIDIPQIQKELLMEIHKLNKPIVLLLHNGRPLTLQWENDNIPAILECWHLGSQAGPAIADVLFGDYNPSGKITMTFPRSVGQIPIHYNMKNTGRPFDPKNNYTSHYLDISNDPLYPFGYGLSYSTFSYSPIKLSTSSIGLKDSLTVTTSITNTSAVDGEEVAQLYIRDLVGSVTRPIKELKGFKKVMIPAGKTVEVSFTISAKDLAFWRKDMTYGVEAGQFKVFVGTNSRDVQESNFNLTSSATMKW